MAFRFKRRVYTHVNSSVLDLAMTGSTALEDARVGLSFSTNFLATGGQPPYTAFTLVSGSLPTGLTITSSAGLLSGIPSTVLTSTFSIEVRDSVGSTASRSYVINTISSGAVAPLELSIQQSTGAPQGVVNSTYSLQINSTGGEPPYSSFTVAGGSLPTGLSMTAAGFISGTPSTTGASTFTIQVRDSVGSTASQSFRLNVISSAAASDTSVHSYYNSLLAHPNLYHNWSMRGQSSVDCKIPLTSTDITVWSYVWPNDPYPDPQDGIKLTKAPNPPTRDSESIPNNNQMNFDIRQSTGSYLMTWDFWYGPEFKTNMGGVTTWKNYQVPRDHSAIDNVGDIYAELRMQWSNANGSTDIATVNMRCYAGSTNPASGLYIPGMVRPDAMNPTGQGALPINGYRLKASVWTRFWAEVHAIKSGDQFTEWTALTGATLPSTTNYRMVSVWMADEVTDPQRIYYRVPWAIRAQYLTRLQWEFNTSQGASSGVGDTDGQTGTLIGYGRNVVILQNATISESDTSIFKRPVG